MRWIYCGKVVSSWMVNLTFNEISEVTMRDRIDDMENKNSKDVYELNVKIIKYLKNIIIVPLTRLINHQQHMRYVTWSIVLWRV